MQVGRCCRCAKLQGLSSRRFAQLVGPIDAETSGPIAAYNEPWKFGYWYGKKLGPGTGGQSPIGDTPQTSGYFADIDLSTAKTAGGSNGTRWLKYMQPVRYQVHGYPGQYNKTVYDTQVSVKKTFISSDTQLPFGESNVVGISHHLSPLLYHSVVHTFQGIRHTEYVQDVSTFEQFAAPYPNERYFSYQFIAYTRLWIDGVDRTGIVATVPVMNIDRPPSPILYGYFTYEFNWQIAPDELIGKTCWVDAWTRYDIRGNQLATPVVRQIGWLESTAAGSPISFLSSNYALTPNTASSKFSLAFDSNGPTGLSSLVMETNTTTGWALTASTIGQTVSKYPPLTTTGLTAFSFHFKFITGDRPIIEYRRATSYLRNGAFAPYLTWSTELFIYAPNDTGHYSNILAPSGVTVKAGKWTPTTATTFTLIGGTAAYDNAIPEFRNGGLTTGVNYTTVPQTITVTQV